MSNNSHKIAIKQYRKSRLMLRNHDENTVLQSSQLTDPSNNAIDFESLIDNDKMKDTSRVFKVTVAVEEFSDDSSTGNMQIEDYGDKLPILNREDIINEANRISEASTNIADKLLSIEVKNCLGLYQKYVPSPFESKIQAVLEKWNEWQKLINVKYRSSPLFYKCYICKLSWWYFYDFNEHLRCHEDFLLDLEKDSVCEVNIVAFRRVYVDMKSFITEGDCPKCGYDYKAHRNGYYRCKAVRCSKKFATCVALKQHEQSNHTVIELTGTPSTSGQWKKACEICHIEYNWDEYNRHMILMHSVRSDFLVPFDYKNCTFCKMNYVCDWMHNCVENPRIQEFCSHCYRILSNECQHFDKNLGCICKICTVVLNKRCMEVEHIMSHTDKFIMVQKCMFCENFEVFLDDLLAYAHRNKEHSQLKIKDMNCFYSIIIPKSCITGEKSIINKEMSPVAHITVKEEPCQKWPDPKLHIKIKQEIFDDCKTDLTNTEEINIKQELIYDEVSNHSDNYDIQIDNSYDGGDLGIKLEMKDEPEDDYEDDIIKLDFSYPGLLEDNQQGSSQDDLHDSVELFQVIKEDKVRQNKQRKKRQSGKMYRCKECGFVATHQMFKKHTHLHINDFLNEVFKCSKCETTFDNFKSYVDHYPQHNLTYMSCPECFKIFDNHDQLMRHIMMHIKKMFKFFKVYTSVHEVENSHIYKCELCLDIVDQSNFFGHWERHLAWVESKMPKQRQQKDIPRQEKDIPGQEKDIPKCMQSLNKSIDEELLRELIKRLQSPEPRSSVQQGCIICHKYFSRKNDCKRHIIEHLLSDALSRAFENDGIKCQICDKVFQKPDKYKGHMRDHGYLPIYQCVTCDKSFSDSSNFTKHKKIHNANAYTCDTCGRKFQAKISIEKHVKIHETQSPIVCEVCNKVFYFMATFKKHLRTHKPLSYRCTLCNQVFPSLKYKWDHLWKAHRLRSQKADCPICEKSFRKFTDLKQHCKIEHMSKITRDVISKREYTVDQMKKAMDSVNSGLTVSAAAKSCGVSKVTLNKRKLKRSPNRSVRRYKKVKKIQPEETLVIY